MGLPATHLGEGISITKPLPEGTNIDPKDSERLKLLIDRDSSTSPVTVLSGTIAEYQVDTTQSTRFKKELKDASDDDVFEAEEEMDEDIQEPDTSPSPHKVQPESSKDKKTDTSDSESSSCFETFRPYDNYMPSTERQLVRNIQNFFIVLYAQVTEDTWEKYKEASTSYVDLKHEIGGFHDATYKANENTDAALRNYQ
ncbi:hypothetical protein Tco_0664610 [Tanacetum coccineum]